MSESTPTSSSAAPVESSTSPSTENTNVESSEAQEESSISGEPSASAAPKTAAEVKKAIRKLKLKVDKGEIEETLPFDLPDDPKVIEYMQRELQKSKMSSKRAEQYSELESEVRDFVELLRKNPKKALSDPTIGLDLKKFAAEIMEEEIARAQKSPEQLEKEAMEAELKALKEEREKEKESLKKQEFERLQEQAYNTYQSNINKAIEKSDLPKSPYVVKKMADYMLFALQEGKDVSPEDVLPLVKAEIHQDIKDMFSTMPEEVIENMIGKDVLTRIRKKNVAKAKANPPVPVNKSVLDTGAGNKPKTEEKSEKKMTLKELFGV